MGLGVPHTIVAAEFGARQIVERYVLLPKKTLLSFRTWYEEGLADGIEELEADGLEGVQGEIEGAWLELLEEKTRLSPGHRPLGATIR